MTIRQILMSFISLSMISIPLPGNAQQNPLFFLEQLVAQRKEYDIQKFKKTYGSLDYTDIQGQTALCRAVYRNDYHGYHLLAKHGANRKHPCIQQIPMSQKLSFDNGYKAHIRNIKIQYADTKSYAPLWWGVGGVVGVGGIVALAAGGGGGSSSNPENNENPNIDFSEQGGNSGSGTGSGGNSSDSDTGTGSGGNSSDSDTGTGSGGSSSDSDTGTGSGGSSSDSDTGTGSGGNSSDSDTGTGSGGSSSDSDTGTGSGGNSSDSDTGTGSGGDSSDSDTSTGSGGSSSDSDTGTGSGGNSSDSDTGTGSGGNSSDSNTGTDEFKPITVSLSPSDFKTTEYKKGNFLDQIGAATAYSRFYTGTKNEDGSISISHNLQPVKVGVIDTGVYTTHSDLKNKTTTGYNFDYGPCTATNSRNCWAFKDASWIEEFFGVATTGYVFMDANGKETDQAIAGTEDEFNEWVATYDSNYNWNNNKTNVTPNSKFNSAFHGTYVAGIIGAEKNNSGMHGVAPNAQIVPIKHDLMSGYSNPIKTLLNNNVKVINMSLGIASNSTYNANMAKTNKQDYGSLMADSLDGFKALADSQSAVFVVAAGNESNSQPSMESGAGLYYPELQKVMLVVVSVDKNNKLSYFSNKCGSTSGYCLAAPGENITSTNNTSGTRTESGTSAAAPIVSGAVAFLMGAYPNLTPANVTSLILETATDLGNPSETGHGLLNLDAATQPVGQLSLATTNSVSGDKLNFSGTKLRIPQVMQMMAKEMPEQVAVLDKYERVFTVPTKNIVQVVERDNRIFQNKLHRFMKFDSIKHIAQDDSPLSFSFSTASKKDSETGIGSMDITYHLGKNDVRFYFQEDTTYGNVDYFDRTTLNPFSAMDNAYGIDNIYHLSQKTNLNFGFISGQNALFKTTDDDQDSRGRMSAFQSGISYQANDKLSINVNGGILNEENSLLGIYGNGGFEIDKTQTYYVGIMAQLSPTDRWRLSGSYYYGMTPSQQLNSFIKTNRLYSESLSFDARYLLDKQNYIGFVLSSPLRIRKGYAQFTLPSGRDYYSDTMYQNNTKLKLHSSAREWDTGIYGVYALTPAIRIKSQGMIRFNPEHQAKAKPDYQVLFGLNWNWY